MRFISATARIASNEERFVRAKSTINLSRPNATMIKNGGASAARSWRIRLARLATTKLAQITSLSGAPAAKYPAARYAWTRSTTQMGRTIIPVTSPVMNLATSLRNAPNRWSLPQPKPT